MHDFEYVATKLGISVEQFKELMKGENRTYKDYKNEMSIMNIGTKVLRFFGVQRAIIR